MYKRVLVPLDGSPLAEAILPFLLEIAGPLDMHLTLLRVVEPIPPSVTEASSRVVVEDVEGRRREAEGYLQTVAKTIEARGLVARCEVRRGQPAHEILEAAKAAGADLIAMGTHGRSGLGRLLFGSVAEAVLRHADVPVFLMRQTAARTAAPADKKG
jgi:nucleotide-binding universal stress UspA family protein